ncbi:MAG: murein biosynthesis integral membrane protein MurJ [Caulobacteraceae bacterium]|nr:murein biosynthesis integral membrane protein MurJ [Caulobacteraceae bacterium]
MIYSGLTLISRFLGLARDLVITARLGASLTPAADAYNTMLAFPNLFRRIFAEGAFAAAFVPAYARTLEKDGKEAADRLASDALATLAATTIILTVVFQLTMPWLMLGINPGYVDDKAKFDLAVLLTQISMPYLPCMAIGALLSGILNARGRFIVSGAFPILLNLVMLIAVLPASDPIAGAKAASVAVLIAGVLQAGVLWWGARKAGANIVLRWPRLTPEIKLLITLAIPGAVSASATQINIFISSMLASLQDGARSWLAVADRLYQLPLGLVGVAIGVALLPKLSASIQAGDHDDAQAATDQALIFALALTLPAAAALVSMPFYLIDGLFTRGQFTVEDARFTAQALFHYGWGVPAFVLVRVLGPAFFARQDTRSPMRFALISVGVNIILGVALFYTIGFQGIAAATAIAAWINVGQMLFTLARRKHYAPSANAWSRIIRVLLACMVMGLALAAASHWRLVLEGLLGGLRLGGLGPKEIMVLLVSLAGGLSYPLLVLAFGGLKVSEIKAALKRSPRQPKAGEADVPPPTAF